MSITAAEHEIDMIEKTLLHLGIREDCTRETVYFADIYFSRLYYYNKRVWFYLREYTEIFPRNKIHKRNVITLEERVK